MTPHYTDGTVTVYAGDCLDVLAELPDASVDAVVTDPPYSLGFMGRKWDTFTGQDIGRGAQARNERAAEVTPTGQGHSTSAGPYLAAGVDSLRAAGVPFQAWCEIWATECLRILKPGGHLLAFGGSRTAHRLACAIEDAGFEVRDSIAWLYGQGFAKGRDFPRLDYELNGDHENAAKWRGWNVALKPAHEPVVVARKPLQGTVAANVKTWGTGGLNIGATRIRLDDGPSTLAAIDGPARDYEPCTCAEHPAYSNDDTGLGRKSSQPPHSQSMPEEGPVDSRPELRSAPLASALQDEYGDSRPLDSRADYRSSLRSGDAPVHRVTGGVQASPPQPRDARKSLDRCASCGCIRSTQAMPYANPTAPHVERMGRWPANVVLDPDTAAELDRQSGELTSPAPYVQRSSSVGMYTPGEAPHDRLSTHHGDSGGASRFFYTAKADSGERVTVNGTAHPTVKPLDLMRWLVRLVTPPGGLVLDPFAGSGTTAEACILERFRCIAIEREPEYLPLITQRINRRRDPAAYIAASGEDAGLFDLLDGESA